MKKNLPKTKSWENSISKILSKEGNIDLKLTENESTIVISTKAEDQKVEFKPLPEDMVKILHKDYQKIISREDLIERLSNEIEIPPEFRDRIEEKNLFAALIIIKGLARNLISPNDEDALTTLKVGNENTFYF